MLRFGTAGIPANSKGLGTIEGIRAVKKLGLDAMELEFVHSVNISEKMAPLVKKEAEDNKIVLTCHGSYYINLNAAEKEKLEASKFRLWKSAQVAGMCGGTSVAFHPGFYGKTKESSFETVKTALLQVVEKLKKEKNTILVAPETTGKHSQFGTLTEVLKLAQEIEQVRPCIDYAHMRAREGRNDIQSFAKILEEIEQALGKEALKNMHIQIAGVNFSSKGELNHLNIKDSDLNYKAIVKTWRDFNIGGVVISESPNIEGDALLLQKEYKNG